MKVVMKSLQKEDWVRMFGEQELNEEEIEVEEDSLQTQITLNPKNKMKFE